MSSDDRDVATPPEILNALLGAVPRLVGRTRSQAEFTRSVLSLLPCVGSVFTSPSTSEVPPGAPEHENIDVLTVIADHGEQSGAGEQQGTTLTDRQRAGARTVGGAEATIDGAEAMIGGDGATNDPAPVEAELAIQGYDSLAASQVVPRLATLDPTELSAIRTYESTNRKRQTILNRVDQLLTS